MPDDVGRKLTTSDDVERMKLWKAFAGGQAPSWYDGPGDRHWTAGVDRMLAALFESGRLLPSGGETSEERMTVFGGRTSRRSVTSWPDGTRYLGPWTEVPTEPAGEALCPS